MIVINEKEFEFEYNGSREKTYNFRNLLNNFKHECVTWKKIQKMNVINTGGLLVSCPDEPVINFLKSIEPNEFVI